MSNLLPLDIDATLEASVVCSMSNIDPWGHVRPLHGSEYGRTASNSRVVTYAMSGAGAASVLCGRKSAEVPNSLPIVGVNHEEQRTVSPVCGAGTTVRDTAPELAHTPRKMYNDAEPNTDSRVQR